MATDVAQVSVEIMFKALFSRWKNSATKEKESSNSEESQSVGAPPVQVVDLCLSSGFPEDKERKDLKDAGCTPSAPTISVVVDNDVGGGLPHSYSRP